ncbi:zinc finger CCCH domain-containing protein 3 [Heteronotia binoei]|uniref:zinc finger CCCH domain-containing protein 3 n=1 Tax=Heteronotia binoei TaxID=13085 RepID=UPI00292D982F|nr:zinc finger CCCH domain-containing protein 3 [Heteronotia binoei]
MEESEQLRRQIRLLQGLIDDHKNVHGNAPVPQPAPVPRWRNSRPPSFSNPAVFSARYPQPAQRDFQPRPPNAWRKKYSLVNVPPRPMLNPGGGSVSAGNSGVVLSHGNSKAAEPQPVPSARRVGVAADGNIIVGVQASSVVRNAAVPASQGGPSKAAGDPSTSRSCEISALIPGIPSRESKPKPLLAVPRLLHHRTVARSKDDSLSVRVAVPSRTVQGATESAPDSCRTISERAIALKTGPQRPLTLPGRESGSLSARKNPASQVPTLQRAPATVDKWNTARRTEAPGVLSGSAGHAPSAVGMSPAKSKQLVPVLQTAPSLPAPAKSPNSGKPTTHGWPTQVKVPMLQKGGLLPEPLKTARSLLWGQREPPS